MPIFHDQRLGELLELEIPACPGRFEHALDLVLRESVVRDSVAGM